MASAASEDIPNREENTQDGPWRRILQEIGVKEKNEERLREPTRIQDRSENANASKEDQLYLVEWLMEHRKEIHEEAQWCLRHFLLD